MKLVSIYFGATKQFIHTNVSFTHLNQNTFKGLAHRNTAKFDNKITQLKAWSFRFNLNNRMECCHTENVNNMKRI